MTPKDSEQYSIPDNEPRGKSSDPKPVGSEQENIRAGAEDESQLEKLEPKEGDAKAPNEVGSPPAGHVEKGE
ncbi:hypothetical protein [Pedobacter sp. SYSU D00535]|uniref:hypothetical protein n=1 Tax=Pedobacter sp. SYSU D00535 TaxID=2810308 RepID=UPI001A959F8C|nr:hypothetical protein [Pedobacter sp. SYSU D00535]